MLRSNQDDNDSENNPISILSQIERRPSCQLTVIPKISRKLSFGGVNEDGGTPPPMRTGFNGHGRSANYKSDSDCPSLFESCPWNPDLGDHQWA